MCIDFEVVERKDGSAIIDVCEGTKSMDYFGIISDDYVEVNIPSSVESIGSRLLSGIPHVGHFNVSPENRHFVEMDGCVYSADMQTLIAYPPSKACECFEIPLMVENIAPGAFRCASQLKSVKVGENVKTIGHEAFARAYSIERIYIDKNVQTIEYLLQECEDLDLYIMYREDLVIGGATGSAIEHWCRENATRFCPLEDSQVEDFLASSEWNSKAPMLDDDECWECMKKSM